MKMSIEEAKTQLIMQKSYALGKDYKAIEVALETMRKFQKIQEVMDSRPDDDAKSNSKALGEIEEIMYGNGD